MIGNLFKPNEEKKLTVNEHDYEILEAKKQVASGAWERRKTSRIYSRTIFHK